MSPREERLALQHRTSRLAWLVPFVALLELLAAAWQRAVPASVAPEGGRAPAALTTGRTP